MVEIMPYVGLIVTVLFASGFILALKEFNDLD
jgi:hypothetical protein